MKVAFVGKGGVGKSTIATLFFLNLIKKNKKVIFFDADLNIHVPKLLGIDFPKNKFLSLTENTEKIRNYLIGKSKKIKSVNYFYKTTPPSRGVRLFEINPQNEIIKNYTEPYKNSYLAVVGTYEGEEIGRSCYHVNLSIFENLLSFSKLGKDEWIVADMVAGIDAFANTLHQQFDVLFLIIEPTQESLVVYNQYLELSQQAKIDNRLFVVGNKIEDREDEKFILSRIKSDKYIGSFKRSVVLKKIRQQNKPITLDLISSLNESLFEKLINISKKNRIDPNIRLKKLHQLHLKYIDQDYVKNAVGDISYQIDEKFKF